MTESIPNYSHDCAGCCCAPTHKLRGVPCIAVTRVVDCINPAVDRCDGCGKGWPSIDHRSERGANDWLKSRITEAA